MECGEEGGRKARIFGATQLFLHSASTPQSDLSLTWPFVKVLAKAKDAEMELQALGEYTALELMLHTEHIKQV